MGFLLDEHGDPKGWVSCILCGFAAMGEDELEEQQDKKKQAEREARWKAKKTPISGQTQDKSDGTSKPEAGVGAGHSRTVESTTEEDITTVVSEQPRPLEAMAPIPTELPAASAKPPDDNLPAKSQPAEHPTIEIVDATPTSDTYQTPPSSATRTRPEHDVKSMEDHVRRASDEDTDGKEDGDKCPRMVEVSAEKVSAEPTQALSCFTNDDYAVLSRRDRRRR